MHYNNNALLILHFFGNVSVKLNINSFIAIIIKFWTFYKLKL